MAIETQEGVLQGTGAPTHTPNGEEPAALYCDTVAGTLYAYVPGTGMVEAANGAQVANNNNNATSLFTGLKTLTFTATIHNLADVDFFTISGWRINSNASYDLTGITAPLETTAKYLFNASNNVIKFKNQSNSSLVANRFRCPENVDFNLKSNCGVQILYDMTFARWLLLSISKA